MNPEPLPSGQLPESEAATPNFTPALQAIGQAPLLPPREPIGARIAAAFGRHHAALLVLCVALLWAIIALPPLWRHEPFQVGMVAEHDVLVPQQAFLEDRDETRRRREDAANLVTPDYDPDPTAESAALEKLTALVKAARGLGVGAPADPLANLRRWRARFSRLRVAPAHLPDAALRGLTTIEAARWSTVEADARLAVQTVYRKGQLRSDVLAEGSPDLAQARMHIETVIGLAREEGRLSEAESKAAAALAFLVVRTRPNQVVNERTTAALREAARRNVPPVYVRYDTDDVLVRSGEIVTDRKWAQMQELGLVTPRLSPKIALARLGMVLMLVLLAAAYLRNFQPHLVAQPAALWLAAMVPVAFSFAYRCLLGVPHAEYLMVPLAATAAMLLTVLINARIGIVAGFLLAALCCVMARADASWLVAATLGSWIGAFCVADISSRGQIVRAGAILAATNAFLIVMLGLMSDMPWVEIGRTAGFEAIMGVASVAFMAGLALFLERPFGITTHLRLLELLSPDETVMRRMQAEAPGTYTHSLMVALLAEAGAKAVGADALLCRVGALYHDIGKLRRPHCFIENQAGHNIHDELSPQLSALIILAHVKDGLELGRALRLPQPVLDIIAQHHGTTVLSYFYNRALQGAQSATIPAADVDAGALDASTPGAPDIKLFRYAGPRPQSKEAAIVLLADTIEASSRTLPDVSPEGLRAHIEKMVAARLREGELSECELTLRDVVTLQDTFTHILRGVLHHRVQYPGAAPGLDEDRDWLGNARREAKREPKRDKEIKKEKTPRPENRPAAGGEAIGEAHGETNGEANGESKSRRRRRRRAEKLRAEQAKTEQAAPPASPLNKKSYESRTETNRDEPLAVTPNVDPSADQSTSHDDVERPGAPLLESLETLRVHAPGAYAGRAPGDNSHFTERAAAPARAVPAGREHH